jgi:hypothetical protein
MASYRVHEFAKHAGVTVKALHHYDRLGLLTPRRTETGYRSTASAIWSGSNKLSPSSFSACR